MPTSYVQWGFLMIFSTRYAAMTWRVLARPSWLLCLLFVLSLAQATPAEIGEVQVYGYGCLSSDPLALIIQGTDRLGHRVDVHKRLSSRPVQLTMGRYRLVLKSRKCWGQAQVAVGAGLLRLVVLHLDSLTQRHAVAEDIYSVPSGYVIGRSPYPGVAIVAMDEQRRAHPAYIFERGFFFDSLAAGSYEVYVYGVNWTLSANVVVRPGQGISCRFAIPTGTSIGQLFESHQDACSI